MGIGRALASRDVLREVLVAFEPAIEVAHDHVRGMRDVAGHQRVDGRERGLDRLALQRVLELVLAREHARGERLTAGRVYRVLEPAADDPAHGCLDHSRIARWPGRSNSSLEIELDASNDVCWRRLCRVGAPPEELGMHSRLESHDRTQSARIFRPTPSDSNAAPSSDPMCSIATDRCKTVSTTLASAHRCLADVRRHLANARNGPTPVVQLAQLSARKPTFTRSSIHGEAHSDFPAQLVG